MASSIAPPADAKPRLKWTRQLHERFVDAVCQLGGADKATPKSVMQMMGIPGLTLYHLKSHLQKYRLAKSREHEMHGAAEERTDQQPQLNEEVLQMQREVQRKLQEQIEVQRHLQLRIEAQGKYLQSVLQKARETLAGCGTSSAAGMEEARAELSELASAVQAKRWSSPLNGRHADCSTDSCLTSLEKAETTTCRQINESGEIKQSIKKAIGLKRSYSSICEDRDLEHSTAELLDLNR